MLLPLLLLLLLRAAPLPAVGVGALAGRARGGHRRVGMKSGRALRQAGENSDSRRDPGSAPLPTLWPGCPTAT